MRIPAIRIFVASLLMWMTVSLRAWQPEVIYSLQPEPAHPAAGLVQGSDGNFYGTTLGGGIADYYGYRIERGTVFKVTTNGVLTTLVLFNEVNGEHPDAALVLGGDGNFYGTTESGGVNHAGTMFRLTPNGVLTTLGTNGIEIGRAHV